MEWLINNVHWNDGITEAVVRRCSTNLLKKRVCEFFKFICTSMELIACLLATPGWGKKQNLTPLG